MQGLCVDRVDRVAHHREDVDIFLHSYSEWDSNPPVCTFSSTLLLCPTQIRIISFLLIPLNVIVHRHKDSVPGIVRPAADMSVISWNDQFSKEKCGLGNVTVRD